MAKFNSLLANDFYKTTHLMQFHPEIATLTSYLTPRGSRLSTTNKMVWFGIQGFIQKYLVEDFRDNFFNKPFTEIADEFHECLERGLGYSAERVDSTLEKIKELHELGYLPVEINALPEGTIVPMGVPALEIRTTKPGFAWVGQALESLLSCSIWHPCVSATVAYEYAKIAKTAFNKTVEDNISWKTAMCDFSLRGQESHESAVASSAAWLTCFYNSSTVDARAYVKFNYNDTKTDYDNLKIGGLTSTEHSVMTSDYALLGDERETYRRLLTEVYPDVSFAAVCDSYDFWGVVTEILPSLREEIEAHEGFLGVRHDSAEPVEALCGIETFYICDGKFEELNPDGDAQGFMIDYVYDMYADGYNEEEQEHYVRVVFTTDKTTYDKIFRVTPEYCNERGAYTDRKYWFVESYSVEYVRETTYQDKGMVETLYELFGGTINSKGYKVVNPKLKAVYGDSITIPRARAIYERLEEKGFAANNVSLGVGSFSMEAIEENGELKPFTRDTFSIAIKATHGTAFDGREIVIYKDPKGFSQKKSLRGLCVPINDGKETYVMQKLNEEQRDALSGQTEFINYFREDTINPYITFGKIRERIDNNLEEE